MNKTRRRDIAPSGPHQPLRMSRRSGIPRGSTHRAHELRQHSVSDRRNSLGVQLHAPLAGNAAGMDSTSQDKRVDYVKARLEHDLVDDAGQPVDQAQVAQQSTKPQSASSTPRCRNSCRSSSNTTPEIASESRDCIAYSATTTRVPSSALVGIPPVRDRSTCPSIEVLGRCPTPMSDSSVSAAGCRGYRDLRTSTCVAGSNLRRAHIRATNGDVLPVAASAELHRHPARPHHSSDAGPPWVNSVTLESSGRP